MEPLHLVAQKLHGHDDHRLSGGTLLVGPGVQPLHLLLAEPSLGRSAIERSDVERKSALTNEAQMEGNVRGVDLSLVRDPFAVRRRAEATQNVRTVRPASRSELHVDHVGPVVRGIDALDVDTSLVSPLPTPVLLIKAGEKGVQQSHHLADGQVETVNLTLCHCGDLRGLTPHSGESLATVTVAFGWCKLPFSGN